MVIVYLFKGVDCTCVYAMPKRFGRGKERLAGFAVYFYTIDLIVYLLCIFMKEKICAVSACKKENMAKHPAFTQEDYPFNYGCIQHSPQFISIGNLYL